MEYWSTLIVSVTLLFSSYQDLVKREVDDVVWMVPSIVGIALNMYFLLPTGIESFIRYGLAVLISASVAFAFYFSGLYGGADAKALTMVALVQPFSVTAPQLHGVNALSVLTNGMILSISLPIFFFSLNCYRLLWGEKIFAGFENEKLYRRLFALFLGTRMKKAAGKIFWGVIEHEKDGVRKFRFNIAIEELDRVDRDDVWITPGIPLLVFFTAGYFLNLLAGDIMAHFFRLLSR
ncbi:MAG: A24 family peptidase C-terminal domain-containing protein [Candidatus Caldarchaeum sp.]